MFIHLSYISFYYFIRIESPCFQVFQGKIKRVMDLLEKFYNLTHSDGRASDGEEYPDHLKSTIELYVSLKEGDENADKNDSVSSKNRQVQNNVIGNPAPLGNDSNATPRDSTRAANERIVGKANLVKRGNDLGGPAITLDMSSDSSDDEGVNTKKRHNNNDNEKKSAKKKCVNIHESLEGRRKELGDLTNALTNVLSKSTQYSEDKFKLKKEMFDRKEDREEKKLMMKQKMFLLSQLRHDIDNMKVERGQALTDIKEATQNGNLQQETIDVLNQSFIAVDKSLKEKQKQYDILQNKMNEDMFSS
jgi:hypothetical protein